MISNNSKIIFLRPIEETDIDVIQNWRNSKNIQPFVREYRELSKKHIKSWLENVTPSNKFEFFIIENEDQLPIGVVGLTYIDWVSKNADIHLAIYDKGWIDDKYAPETLRIMLEYGFQHLNLHRIYAEVYEVDNKKIDFFTSNNFTLDGVLRNHHYYNGKYIDSHIYSILKPEYEKR
jgi:RimJ/RimL family protein N-acetyltransferase